MTNNEIEEGTNFAPRFDANGLITAVVADERSGEILMLAHMNAEALERTIETREGWFYSRSRKSLWKKGETSGNVLRVSAMKVDCDQDAVLLKVSVAGDGKTCHTGRRSCFYREVPLGRGKQPLTFAE
jgi:phosphoribosyl-AMP cyclohydrolase